MQIRYFVLFSVGLLALQFVHAEEEEEEAIAWALFQVT
jgi:hypothetical protein